METMRDALIALFAESIGMVGELSAEEETVLNAWNEDVPGALRIDPDDIEGAFED